MKDNSVLKLGTWCAVLLGIAKLFSGGLYLFMSPDLHAEVPAAKFLPAFNQQPGLLLALFWCEVLVGIFGIAVVPALSGLVKQSNEGWVRWTSTLATAGFVISATGFMLSAVRLPGIAAAFVNGDASVKAALAATWKASIDPTGFWGYAAIGLWILVFSLLSMNKTEVPKGLAYLGFLYFLLSLVVLIGSSFKIQILLILAAGIGGIVAPIWWIWSGWMLSRIKV